MLMASHALTCTAVRCAGHRWSPDWSASSAEAPSGGRAAARGAAAERRQHARLSSATVAPFRLTAGIKDESDPGAAGDGAEAAVSSPGTRPIACEPPNADPESDGGKSTRTSALKTGAEEALPAQAPGVCAGAAAEGCSPGRISDRRQDGCGGERCCPRRYAARSMLGSPQPVHMHDGGSAVPMLHRISCLLTSIGTSSW